MQNDTVKFILRHKSFPIPSVFRHLIDISPAVSRSLIYNSNHEYQVESNVSDEVFQSFIDYLVNDKLPEIEIETFNEFFQLSEEFQILGEFVEERRGQFGDYLVNLNGLKDNKNAIYSICAEKVALKLDEYIENYGDILMKLPIQTLHIVFNHEKRNLTNHNRAYEMINRYFERTNDRNIFILLESLDGSKLSKSNIEESFKKRKSRMNYIPNIEFSYLSDSFEKQRKLEEKVTELENIIKIMNIQNEKDINKIVLKHQNEMKNLKMEISKEIDCKINNLMKKYDEEKNLLITQNEKEISNLKKYHTNEIDELKKQINLLLKPQTEMYKEESTKTQSSIKEQVNKHKNDDEMNDEDEKEEEEGNNDDEINEEDYYITDVNQGISMANKNGLTTVFIRNIPYSATAKDLGDFLIEKIGDVTNVQILQTTYLGKKYSRGMGFVEFKTPESCLKALSVQNIEFKAPEPQNLVIRLAKPKKKHDTAFIKGIPIGTKEEDLFNVFQSVKPIKVIIIRYDDDKNLGLAYAQFASEEDLNIALQNCKCININNSKSGVFISRVNLDQKRIRRYPRRRRFGRMRAPRNNQDSAT